MQKVGAVAYKLDLPPASKIYPVFHVSQLKQALRPTEMVSPESLLLEDFDVVVPGKFLQERLVKKGNKLLKQVQVEWQGVPGELTSWEELHSLHRLFPEAPAWGHAGSLGGGNVTTFLKHQEYEKVKKQRRRQARTQRAAMSAKKPKVGPLTTQEKASPPSKDKEAVAVSGSASIVTAVC